MGKKISSKPRSVGRKLQPPSKTAIELAKSLTSASSEGKYEDLACTKAWLKPSSKKGCNTEGHAARYYDWGRAVVVENAGFLDSYVRKMTVDEQRSHLVERASGAIHRNPESYSTVTSFVVVRECGDVDEFGLPVGSATLRNITASCDLKC